MGGGWSRQSCKLLRHLGTVDLDTSSRIWKIYPTLFGMSKILRVTPTLFGFFGLFFADFWEFLKFFANFGNFLLLLLEVGFESMNQVPSRLRIICRSVEGVLSVMKSWKICIIMMVQTTILPLKFDQKLYWNCLLSSFNKLLGSETFKFYSKYSSRILDNIVKL